MSFDNGYRKSAPVKSLPARFAAASLVLGSFMLTAPAQAEGIKDSVLGFFNMNPETRSGGPEAALDYRPRAPLVIPPKLDLPPPQQTSALPNDWPVDPDAAARRKALADSHRRAPGADKPDPTAARRAAAAAEKQDDDCQQVKGQDYCLISSPWTYVTDKIGWSSKSDGNGVLLTGEEPNRKYLTDPPTGFRIPSEPVEMPKDKNGKTLATSDEKPGMLSSFWNKITTSSDN